MKETNRESVMIDFREYLQIEDYLMEESDDIFEYYDEQTGEFKYDESPFAPIEIGDYVLYLFASEQNFCSPQFNSFDKYFFNAWEVCVEKFHSQYGYVVCTAEVMNELGFDKFEAEDHYVAYAGIETVQKIFEHLVNKLKLPKI